MSYSLTHKFWIFIQWGKGLSHMYASTDNREEAFRKAIEFKHIHHKRHKRGNVPTIYIVSREAHMLVMPAPNKPKKLPLSKNIRIHAGNVTLMDSLGDKE
jgi:hypothetical protein